MKHFIKQSDSVFVSAISKGFPTGFILEVVQLNKLRAPSDNSNCLILYFV